MAKILAAALALSVVGVRMTASLRTSSSAAAFQERIFENKIPSHIPIKIKIKKEKEKSFKDLKNEKWLREFELELTNTGDRPIYFLYITMDTDVKFDRVGPEIVFPLTYGRAQLGDIVTKATSDDVAIKPGETIILTAGNGTAWEQAVRENRWPESTKFSAEIQVLSFGDGTGYFGTELYPPPGRPRAVGNMPVSGMSVVGILMTASLRTSSSATFQERIFENKIPSHIPLKIKIKKENEESFKDLKNEKWLRGFELELTNTGDKPIYFVHIIMGTNVKVDNGLEMVYPLTYGRAQLGDIVSKATSDDSPINPGETIVLQIREAPYWEKGVREGWWPQATKFTASIQVLSFGDGTGYFGTQLYPPAETESSRKR